VVSATTFTTPDPAGGFDVVSDAYIPMDR
jgi:hypothetical protein